MAVGQIAYISDKDRLAKTFLDNDVRMQSMASTRFRNISRPVKGYGKNKGQDVEIEKWGKLAKATTPIDELTRTPAVKPTITFVTKAPDEYGNAVVRTRFGSDIAEYSVPDMVRKLITINVAESLDTVAGVEFRNSDVFWTPTGTVAAPTGTIDKDATVSTAALRNIQSYDFRQIRKHMKNDLVPTWDGSYYLAVLSAFAEAALYEDTNTGGTIDLRKYDMPEELISGEIGAYFGFRFLTDTNVLSDTIGTSAFEGEVIVCGFDPVAEVLVNPEEITAESWDHKRFMDLAWHAITGYKKIWANTADGEYRIVRIWAT